VSIDLGGKLYNIDRDRGCRFFPRCLECPFPDCMQGSAKKRPFVSTYHRYATMTAELGASGETVAAVASRYNVGQKTVYRALQWAKENPILLEGVNTWQGR